MKKFLVSLLASMLVFSFGATFATDDLTAEAGETVYLEDYSQYQDVLNDMDYQAEYKKLYEQMIAEMIEEEESLVRTKIYRAKVLEASEPQVQYGQYTYYDYFYRTSYQPLKIEILDGEYKGEVLENFNYILTCDSYENIRLPEVKKGDIVNVVLGEDEEGNLLATFTTYDAPLQRWPVMLILVIIGLILIAIYTGKHYPKFLLPLIVLLDLIFIVTIPSVCEGVSIALLASFIVFLSVVLVSVLKFGKKNATFVVILSTTILTIVIAMVVYGFDSLANMCGITYDSAYTMESILPVFVDGELENVIDFHALSMGTTILMAFFGILSISVKTMEIYSKKSKSKDIVKNVIDDMQEPLADSLFLIMSVLLVSMMQKYMLFIVNKCSLAEILNSEVLICELSRILFTLIAMSVTVPVTAMLGRFMDEEF